LQPRRECGECAHADDLPFGRIHLRCRGARWRAFRSGHSHPSPAAGGDLGNFSGYAQGSPDYERLINIVHDAAISAGKRLCGPFNWRDRPDFTCFQNGSETAAIARGVAAELGPLANTQGKVEVGPFAPKK
jgi:hypothetical protein